MNRTEGAPPTAERILEAAVRLFARQGYAATSMEEIGREVGITKPAIYHHFKGKDALLRALMRIVERENFRLFDEVRARHLPLPELMEVMIHRRLALAKEYPDWIRFMLRLDITPQEMPEMADMLRMHDEFHAREEDLLAETLGDLSLRPGLTLSRFVQFAHDAVFAFIARHTLCVDGGIGDVAEESRRLRDLILHGALRTTEP
jgi:AcrR family transcriptional regulator